MASRTCRSSDKVADVIRQLERREAVIVFDPEHREHRYRPEGRFRAIVQCARKLDQYQHGVGYEVRSFHRRRGLVHGGRRRSRACLGATINVANNGLDTATCGAFSNPCRSITRGIFRAASGDTVLVRPGRYGDLNRDGLLGGPGEEFPGFGAVEITKPLRIVSTAGASVTVIDGGNGASLFAVVRIFSNNVTFGEPGAGFLLDRRRIRAIQRPGDQRAHRRKYITGVRIHGFTVTTNGFMDVSNNVAHDLPGAGFIIASLHETQRVVLRHNQGYTNGHGILSAGRGRHEVAYNDVSNNLGTGISVDFAPSFIHHNSVAGNDMGIASNSWSTECRPAPARVVSQFADRQSRASASC